MVRNPMFAFASLSRGVDSGRDGYRNTQPTSPISSPRSPSFASHSKAEELLGPSETGVTAKQSWGTSRCLGRMRLKKKSSALSITADEQSYAGARPHKEAGHEVRMQASSPVLRPAEYESLASFANRSVHTVRSTSTLQSRYESTGYALALSQQTSTPSARGMAIRNGYPPISIPPRRMAFQSSYERRAEVEKKQPESSQRKTTNVDLSTLLPKSQAREGPLLSPHKVTPSPSLLSLTSDAQPSQSSSLRAWLGLKKSKSGRQPMTIVGNINSNNLRAMSYTYNRGDVTKAEIPKHRDEVENWLDDAELEDDFDTMGERSTLEKLSKGNRPSPTSSGEDSQLSTSSVQTLTSQRSLSASKQPMRSRPSLSPQTSAITIAPPGQMVQRSGSNRVSKIKESDLQIESVLALSSSDDDSESEPKPKKSKPQRTLGVAITDFGSQAKPSSQPEAKLDHPNHDRGARPSQHRNFAKPFRPSPSHRNANTSFLSQSSSVHWDLDSTKEQVSPHSSFHTLRPHPEPRPHSPNLSRQTTPSPTSFSHEKPPNRLSRMMAVSAEEEKLLSAMRSKRASMRKAIIAESIALAIDPGLLAPRPKTAESDARSSFYEPDMDSFPHPPGTILRVSKGSLSNDDLRLLQLDLAEADAEADIEAEAETKPKPKPKPTLTPTQMPHFRIRAASVSQHSSRLGSTANSVSDFIPSPTTSHEAPLTPPPDGYEAFGSGPHGDGAAGHSRKRTVSSVLFLDGVEERARERDEELAVWSVVNRA